MCIYFGHMCVLLPYAAFVSIIPWLGGLPTDNDDNDDAGRRQRRTHNGQSTIVRSLVNKPNEPKVQCAFFVLFLRLPDLQHYDYKNNSIKHHFYPLNGNYNRMHRFSLRKFSN